jgi:hypothetical protein
MIAAVGALAGLAIIYWSWPLSERYNALTTRFREHYPQINPPPTPERRKRTTLIFAWLLRIVGGYLVFLAARVAFNF